MSKYQKFSHYFISDYSLAQDPQIGDVVATKLGFADNLREIHKNENVDEIDDGIDKLNEAWASASQKIYQATQQEAGAGTPLGAGPGATGGNGTQQ